MTDWTDTHLAADFDGEDWPLDWDEMPGDDGYAESFDLSDEAYVLASAGWGTDEDYGSYEADPWESNFDYEPPF